MIACGCTALQLRMIAGMTIHEQSARCWYVVAIVQLGRRVKQELHAASMPS